MTLETEELMNVNSTCSFDTLRLTSTGSSTSEKDVMAFFSLESGWQYLQHIQNKQSNIRKLKKKKKKIKVHDLPFFHDQPAKPGLQVNYKLDCSDSPLLTEA